MTSIPIHEGFFPFRGYQSYYKVVGDVTQKPAGIVPLLAIHGRLCSHEALEPLASLAATGQPVIFYDQLGIGQSDKPDDPTLWSIALFVDEVEAIRRHLQLNRVHVLGHSWGGVVAMEYALRQPKGIVSLILHSSYVDRAMISVDLGRLRAELPAAVQEILHKHEAAGTTQESAYQQAERFFDLRHICRVDPWPAYLERSLQYPPVGNVTTKDWDIRARLSEIKIPTLITCGRHDFCTPVQAGLIHKGIPGSELVIFEASSHYAHIEETDRYLALLQDFMSRQNKA